MASLKDIVEEEQAKRKLLTTLQGLKKSWYECNDLFQSFSVNDINKYISEKYPFCFSFDEMNVAAWVDTVADILQTEDYDIESKQLQFEEIDNAFNRFRYEYYTDKGTISEAFCLLDYKDLPAIIYQNDYDKYYLVAYIKDGELQIENDREESLFDYAEEQGWSKDDVFYMKHGVHLNELDASELKEIEENKTDDKLESLWKMYEESTLKEAQLEAEKETVNPEYLGLHIIEKSTQNGITNGILRCIESLSPDKKEVNRKAFEIFSRVRGLSITEENQTENESSNETEENEMGY